MYTIRSRIDSRNKQYERRVIQHNNIESIVRWVDDVGLLGLQGNTDSDYDIVTRRTKTMLAAGTLLTVNNTESIPAVYQNNTVTLILRLPNNVQVKTQGVALENGSIGNAIRVVRTVNNQKRITYSGTVIRDNTVQVPL